jgi:hypothetical protein
MPARNAASVFPDPVGAQINALRPDAIAGQPPACAGVGAANEDSNHARTGVENDASASSPVAFRSVANPSIIRIGRTPPAGLSDCLSGLQPARDGPAPGVRFLDILGAEMSFEGLSRPLVAALAGAVLLGLPTGAPAAVPDAGCPPLGGGNYVTNGDNRFAQTFTAGLSGNVTAAELRITKNVPDGPGDYVLGINEVDGSGSPTNNVLATTTIPETSVPGGSINLPVTAQFAQPATVVAGQQYALVVSRPGSGGFGLRLQGRSDVNPCPGSLFLSNGQVNPFMDIGADLIFTTFVEEPAADQAPETTIGAAPKAKTKKRKATFEFSGTDTRAVAGFECSLDGAGFAPCNSPQVYKRLKRGRHEFRVRAIDSAGNADPTPASANWKVKKKKKKKRKK